MYRNRNYKWQMQTLLKWETTLHIWSFETSSPKEDFQLSVMSSTDVYGFSVTLSF